MSQSSPAASRPRGCRSASCTETSAVSDTEVGDPKPAVVALGGGHGLAASLRCAAPDYRRTDRGRDRRRRRWLERTAAARLRRAAARRPADGAGGALRTTTSGGGPGAGWCSTGSGPGRPARAQRREPADRGAVGDCRPRSGGGLDWVARSSRPTGRVLPMSTVPLEIRPQRSSGDPIGLTRAQVRGQVAVATTADESSTVVLPPAPPPACPAGGRRRSTRPTGWCWAQGRGSPA